ncbi:MAG: helix-turn-helix domain-containing protein [Bacteroides sp.]|nr:helix-turn-helix domain-containing protein [Bacteroides sp.]
MTHEHSTKTVNVCPSQNVILLYGDSREEVGKFLSPATVDCGMFMMIASGTATISINTSEYSLNTNSFATILPHNIIQLKALSQDFSCRILAFTPQTIINADVIREFLSRLGSCIRLPVLQLTDDEVYLLREFHQSFQSIYYRAKNQQGNSLMIQNLLVSYVCGVCKLYDSHTDDIRGVAISRKEEILLAFTSLVLMQHTNHRTVAYYADQLCITPYYLNSICKELKGKNASDIITDIVIQAIKVRLKSTKNTIQQIAEEMNFPTSSFFSMYFKRETGISPKQYRSS